nr:putative uncharacterized protein ENSP00000383309 [Aegilops tauschii subsp. strangulata]
MPPPRASLAMSPPRAKSTPETCGTGQIRHRPRRLRPAGPALHRRAGGHAPARAAPPRAMEGRTAHLRCPPPQRGRRPPLPVSAARPATSAARLRGEAGHTATTCRRRHGSIPSPMWRPASALRPATPPPPRGYVAMDRRIELLPAPPVPATWPALFLRVGAASPQGPDCFKYKGI